VGHGAAADHEVDHLGHGEQADECRHKVYAIPQIRNAQCEALVAVDVVVADERDHEAEPARDEGPQHLAVARRRHDHEPEEGEEEEFGRPEQQHQLLGHRQDSEHRQGADDAANRVGAGRGADREAGLALLCQRIAVEAGRGIGCRARCIEQDRGDRAAHRHRTHDPARER
jgi:hypothetical protein